MFSFSLVNRYRVEYTLFFTVDFDGRYGIWSLDLDVEWSVDRHLSSCWKRAVSALRVICQGHVTNSKEDSNEIENAFHHHMV